MCGFIVMSFHRGYLPTSAVLSGDVASRCYKQLKMEREATACW